MHAFGVHCQTPNKTQAIHNHRPSLSFDSRSWPASGDNHHLYSQTSDESMTDEWQSITQRWCTQREHGAQGASAARESLVVKAGACTTGLQTIHVRLPVTLMR